jgi:NhaP-type Na+/H+ or K+/H+ antiporter
VALLLAFSACLLAAVLVSARAHRTVLSTAVLFLLGGVGLSAANLVSLSPEDDVVTRVAEVALFGVLFSDGMRSGVRDLASAWHLPGRALLVGMPVTVGVTAVLAWLIADLPWGEAFLLGAVLAPTDPVFAAAIVGRQEVPGRLRHLLNVESGLNDGLALPVVVVLLDVLGGGDVTAGTIATELAAGVALGAGIPWIALRLEHSRFFAASGVFQPLNGVAIGLLVYAAASMTHANLFLAAFTAGVTVATVGPEAREAFRSLGEQLTEVLKLLALLVFGVLMSPSFLAQIPLSDLLFAVSALLVARPLAIVVTLAGSDLPVRQKVSAAWFGPKGFASVVYAIHVLDSGVSDAGRLFHLAAIVIAVSILAHSSTDVVVARWLDCGEPAESGDGAAAGEVSAGRA